MDATKNKLGPKGHWLLGSTPEFAKGTLAFVEKNKAIYGDIFQTKVAFKHFTFLLDAQGIQHVLKHNHRNYKKSFAYNGLKDFLGNGLLTSEGKEWEKKRKMVQPVFYKKALQEIEERLIATNKAYFESLDSLDFKDIRISMMQLTQKLIMTALFEQESNGKNEVLLQKFMDYLPVLRQHASDKLRNPLKAPLWMPTSTNKAYFEAKKGLEVIIKSIIEGRKQQTSSESLDLLNMLMHTKDEDGKLLTDYEMYEQITTLFIAGQETTANALTFCLYLLAKHPEIYTKYQKLISEDNEHKKQYLEELINESMRLYPPAWAISRTALQEDQIGTFHIPKGGVVFMPFYFLHRNEAWGNPDQFQPERFRSDYPKHLFMPFGGGPRICIGGHLATMELKIVLEYILTNYNIEKLKKTDLELITPMTLTPKFAVEIQFSQK